MAKELDAWISKLEDCKQLEESQVKVLCDKVSSYKHGVRELSSLVCVYRLYRAYTCSYMCTWPCTCIYFVNEVKQILMPIFVCLRIRLEGHRW